MKHRLHRHVVLVALLLVATGAVSAQDGEEPPARGVDRANEVITTNMQRQIERLTALLDRVPEQAHPGIEQAIESLQQGMTNALVALGEPEPPEDDDAPEGEAALEGEATPEAEPTGRERARQAIASGTGHAEAALNQAMAEVPENAQAGLEKALSRIAAARERALAALDRVDVGTPEQPAAATSRPAEAGRPERAERPDQPTRPVRPERAETPTRPERPTRRDG